MITLNHSRLHAILRDLLHTAGEKDPCAYVLTQVRLGYCIARTSQRQLHLLNSSPEGSRVITANHFEETIDSGSLTLYVEYTTEAGPQHFVFHLKEPLL